MIPYLFSVAKPFRRTFYKMTACLSIAVFLVSAVMVQNPSITFATQVYVEDQNHQENEHHEDQNEEQNEDQNEEHHEEQDEDQDEDESQDQYNNTGTCVLDISKTVNQTDAHPGDTVTYTISVSNTGTANCTGGGVKIQDDVDPNLEFISETHSSNFSSGYGCLAENSCGQALKGNVLTWNGHTMIPGASGTITWTGKIKEVDACNNYSLTNIARVSSYEYHWVWQTSNQVETLISCSSANTAPAITLLGGGQFTLAVGDTFTDPGATAHDAEDGDITADIVVTGTVSTTTPGTYTLQYNVKDSKGLSAEEKTRTVTVMPRTIDSVTIITSKIVCNTETDLPNWGLGGPDITSHTAGDYVAAHNGCRLVTGWNFQWGNQDVVDPGKSFIGEAVNGWHTFGVTDMNGVATATITHAELQNINKIWVREVLKDTYIPFTYDQQHKDNSDAKSAEMYCYDDVLNYDNYDVIRGPESGKTYYCVAWNALKENATNTPPVITLLGAATTTITVGNVFTDPGATAHDAEDGDITADIVVTGSVATSTVGSYTLHYNVNDSQGLSAEEKTRTVVVVSGGGGGGSNPECSDGADNDGDGKIDTTDPTCHSDGNPENSNTYTPSKNTENSAPVITLLGATTTAVTLGDTFTDPGATAFDEEDGDITANIVVTGSVATTTVGSYTLQYNVKDSKGLSAEEKTWTVTVNEKPVITVTPPGGGGGCSGNCGGGGGGGVVFLAPSLRVFNETIEETSVSGVVLIRWQTNIPADSRVVYGTTAVPVLGTSDTNYGYQTGTPTITALVTNHVMAVSGINPETQYFFRPVSKQGSLSATGIELTLASNECYYLREFIKFGADNNPIEVKKLQVFLNSFEGTNLPVTGFYSLSDFNAVFAFQDKYKTDIIDPWGDTTRGYVYLTTRKKVNEIYCQAAFPLDQNQLKEVAAFKKLLESLKLHGIIPTDTTTEISNVQNENETGVTLGTTTIAAEELTVSTDEESASSVPVTGRGAFQNMLGAVYAAVSKTAISHGLGIVFGVLVLIAAVLLREFYKKEEEEEEAESIFPSE